MATFDRRERLRSLGSVNTAPPPYVGLLPGEGERSERLRSLADDDDTGTMADIIPRIPTTLAPASSAPAAPDTIQRDIPVAVAHVAAGVVSASAPMPSPHAIIAAVGVTAGRPSKGHGNISSENGSSMCAFPSPSRTQSLPRPSGRRLAACDALREQRGAHRRGERGEWLQSHGGQGAQDARPGGPGWNVVFVVRTFAAILCSFFAAPARSALC